MRDESDEWGNFDVVAVLPDGRRGYCDGRWLWTSTGTTIHHRSDAEEYAARLRAQWLGVEFAVAPACYSESHERICTVDGAVEVVESVRIEPGSPRVVIGVIEDP